MTPEYKIVSGSFPGEDIQFLCPLRFVPSGLLGADYYVELRRALNFYVSRSHDARRWRAIRDRFEKVRL